MRKSNDLSELPWRFEAFREYVTFESMQPASAVLSLFEGEFISPGNPRIKKLEQLLAARSGKNKWVPQRSGSEDIRWNPEGDFTRNKERVFTSLLVMFPKDLSGNLLKLTDFGSRLAMGQIGRKDYYHFIIFHYKFPHPAYADVWSKWRAAGREVYPFLLILQCLLGLYKNSPQENSLSTKEVEKFLMPCPLHSKVDQLVDQILDSRKSGGLKSFKGQGDKTTRKINDILGFMCVSGICFYKTDGSVALNTIAVHPEELTWFEGVRKPAKKDEENPVATLEGQIVRKLSKENLL